MTFADLVNNVIVPFVNDLIVPLIYAVAFVMFLIGVVRFFFLGEGEENRDKGKQLMIWSIIGFAVMFSMWGLVRVVLTTFSIQV